MNRRTFMQIGRQGLAGLVVNGRALSSPGQASGLRFQ